MTVTNTRQRYQTVTRSVGIVAVVPAPTKEPTPVSLYSSNRSYLCVYVCIAVRKKQQPQQQAGPPSPWYPTQPAPTVSVMSVTAGHMMPQQQQQPGMMGQTGIVPWESEKVAD